MPICGLRGSAAPSDCSELPWVCQQSILFKGSFILLKLISFNQLKLSLLFKKDVGFKKAKCVAVVKNGPAPIPERKPEASLSP